MFGTDTAQASWVWEGSWTTRPATAIDGLKLARSAPDGTIVGIIGHNVVAIDRATGEVARSVALPEHLAQQADAGQLNSLERLRNGEENTGITSVDQLDDIVNTLWLQVGGSVRSPVAVHCAARLEHTDVSCEIF